MLVVGKAKNLRKRLARYRAARPERLPRRLIRMRNDITRIESDVGASDRAARDREAWMIWFLAPKFNRTQKIW